MTITPSVELRFNPTELRTAELARSAEFLGSPADALEAGLIATRRAVVERMKEELVGTPDVTVEALVRVADLAWQGVFWRFRKISAPAMADAYIRAYRDAGAGDVPMSVIYQLADNHTEKIGEYFHESSKDAMVRGFNTYVNRRMGRRAAMERVLDAYGVTPRQMNGYTAATKSLEAPLTTGEKRSVAERARRYVLTSVRNRIRKLAAQEEHNVDQQAQQFAWMWMLDKGRLTERAEKLWITAHDERVCKICGPLHNKRVKINEQFTTAEGKIWTPGLHPNCRCIVRLLEHKYKIGKRDAFGIQKDLAGGALLEFNRIHVRDERGRWTTVDRPRPPIRRKHTMAETPEDDTDAEFKAMVSDIKRLKTKPAADLETRKKFAEIISNQRFGDPVWGFQSPFVSAMPIPQIMATAELADQEDLARAAITQNVVRTAVPPELVPLVEQQLKARAQTKVKVKTEPRARPALPTTVPLSRTALVQIGDEQFTRTKGGAISTSRVQLTPGNPSMLSDRQAAESAVDQLLESIESDVETILDNTNNGKFAERGPSGEMIVAQLSTDDIREVLGARYRDAVMGIAHPERRGEPEGTIPVEFRNLDGTSHHSEPRGYHDLERTMKLGVGSEPTVPFIARVNEGHAESTKVIRDKAGRMRGVEFDGVFDVTGISTVSAGEESWPIPVVDLQPRVTKRKGE